MPRQSRRAFLAAGGGTVAALAGCLGDLGATGTDEGDADGKTSTRTPVESAQVGATCSSDGSDWSFNPGLVWLEPGSTVTWVSQTNCAQRIFAFHPDNDAPLRIPEGAASFSSDFMKKSGSTYDYTFDTPGVYDYFGLQAGQVGTIVVGRPSADGQPGLAEPQSGLPSETRAELTRLNDQTRALLSTR